MKLGNYKLTSGTPNGVRTLAQSGKIMPEPATTQRKNGNLATRAVILSRDTPTFSRLGSSCTGVSFLVAVCSNAVGLEQAHSQPTGVMILGLNPYLPLDDAYHDFIDPLAGQIAAGLSDVRAYERERRAQALAEIDRGRTIFGRTILREDHLREDHLEGRVDRTYALQIWRYAG